MLRAFCLALFTHTYLFNLQVYRILDNSPQKKSGKKKEELISPSTTSSRKKRVVEVRNSAVHGKGVFATQDIPEGLKLLEYKGEIISWEEAQERHPHDPKQPNHTFFFQRDDGMVIDGGSKGNAARWINHSCDPNCETQEKDGRIFVYALRNIAEGEELNYDYGLVLDGRHTKKVKAEYACFCGSSKCRGTMLASKKR